MCLGYELGVGYIFREAVIKEHCSTFNCDYLVVFRDPRPLLPTPRLRDTIRQEFPGG